MKRGDRLVGKAMENGKRGSRMNEQGRAGREDGGSGRVTSKKRGKGFRANSGLG